MALVSDMVFSMLVVASFVLGAGTIGFAVAWIRARERAIRAEQRLAPAGGGDDRFDRLEDAMHAMAAGVERMSEGQRFVSRVLVERAAPAKDPVARAPHVATPR